jgi:hypothetical protein
LLFGRAKPFFCLSASRSLDYNAIQAEIVLLLDAARRSAARSVNAVMTATYWGIGRRIVDFDQGGKHRAGYGEQLIERVSHDLTEHFGRGFSASNLEQMRQFSISWAIPQTPSAELGSRFPLPWPAYVRLPSVKNQAARPVL